jgi:hypothetical protein
MSENIFQDIKEEKQAKIAFEQLKSDGYRLMQEGKIDAKTYYSKTRDAGIELGLISPQDYPGRLPSWAEGFLEVVGGVGGAIVGGIAGAPAGPAGIIAGAGAGAGVGSGSGSLAADFLGDLLAPDMPAPSASERIKDAAITGAIDTGLTVAVPVAGKALKPAVTKIVDKAKGLKEAAVKKSSDPDSTLSFLERQMGITDEAAEQAVKLADEGIDLSLGQASTSPFVRGVYNLTSRMPLAGTPGQKQLAKTFEQVDKALSKRISPTAKRTPMTEVERSKMIKEFGLQSFKDWRNSYTSVYRKAKELNKKKGNFFDTTNLIRTVNTVYPKSRFTDAPKDVLDLFNEIRLYRPDFVVGRRGVTEVQPKLSYNDVEALDTKLTNLAKKYDPATGSVANNYAYRSITALQDSMKRQLRDPKDQAGRLMAAGDRLFKEYMAVVEGKTGKEFQKALGRGALRPGVGRPPSQRIEDLYAKTFSDAKSPESVKELKNIIGTKKVNELAANYLDDLFNKYLKSEKRDFGKLYNELGFDNLKSKRYAATQELLKDYQFTKAEDLFEFLNILKQFPEALPDVNTFILRSGLLRSAQSLGPTALIGTTGISAGGGVGAFAGFGFLRLLNQFLSNPFDKSLFRSATKNVAGKKEEFMKRFLSRIPKLPDSPVPPSALAVQPAVPLVSEQVQQEPTTQ